MRPLKDIVASAAANILERMKGYTPQEKLEILILMNSMVQIELAREARAAAKAQPSPVIEETEQ